MVACNNISLIQNAIVVHNFRCVDQILLNDRLAYRLIVAKFVLTTRKTETVLYINF